MGTRQGNGEAKIVQLPSGSYRTQVLAAGRRLSITGKTKEEVKRKRRELLASADKGIVPIREHYSLQQFVARWLEDVVLHTTRPRTLEFYTEVMSRYVLPELGTVRLAFLQPAQVQRLQSKLLDRGLSTRTVRHVHTVLRTCLEQAVRWNLMPRHVADTVDPPRVQREELQVLTAEQVKALLAAGSGRLVVLLNVAVNTGMRQSELLGLRWRDVDLDRGELRVRNQYGRDGQLAEPKSGRGRRTIDLPIGTVAALREHRTQQIEDRLIMGPDWEDMDFVFCTHRGRPLGHRNVLRDFAALLKRADLPAVPFHVLRHTHATLLLSAGVPVGDVSARLGHSSAAMTLDVYGHVLPDAGRAIAARLELLLA